MASNHASLDAAATERKARLAKLKSLKRKQTSNDAEDQFASNSDPSPAKALPTSIPELGAQHLSGRNYDHEARGPKLGFENAPNADVETLEDRAAVIASETREKNENESRHDKPIDLFQLQPKKPNWDLKRDVARKMEVLNARTENAIARLVRERIEGQKKKDQERMNGRGEMAEGEISMGMGGVELVEGMYVREREEEEDLRREREQDDEVT